MEKNGWILRKISYSYFFKFEKKKSPPRSVKYVYTFTDRNDVGMSHLEEHLKSTYFANFISCGRFGSGKFYRVVDIAGNIDYIQKEQIGYLKKVYFARIIAALFLMSPFVIDLTTNYSYNMILSGIFNVLGVCSCIYMLNCVIGLLYLCKIGKENIYNS